MSIYHTVHTELSVYGALDLVPGKNEVFIVSCAFSINLQGITKSKPLLKLTFQLYELVVSLNLMIKARVTNV